MYLSKSEGRCGSVKTKTYVPYSATRALTLWPRGNAPSTNLDSFVASEVAACSTSVSGEDAPNSIALSRRRCTIRSHSNGGYAASSAVARRIVPLEALVVQGLCTC